MLPVRTAGDGCMTPLTVISRKDARAAGLKRYFTGKPCSRGHISERLVNAGCVECHSILGAKAEAKARAEGKEWATARSRNHYARDPQRRRDSSKRWRDRNRDRVREAGRDWRERNLAICAHHASLRKARILQATPPWVDLEEIKEIYRQCPEGHHVDHIMPLVHAKLCGLHVPWNLQYLPASENRRKGNRIPAC